MFLYTNNKPSKKEKEEMRKTTPFTIATKRITFFGINLAKEVKNLYTKNYKTLMKETENHIKKWKDTPCSWIGKN